MINKLVAMYKNFPEFREEIDFEVNDISYKRYIILNKLLCETSGDRISISLLEAYTHYRMSYLALVTYALCNNFTKNNERITSDIFLFEKEESMVLSLLYPKFLEKGQLMYYTGTLTNSNLQTVISEKMVDAIYAVLHDERYNVDYINIVGFQAVLDIITGMILNELLEYTMLEVKEDGTFETIQEWHERKKGASKLDFTPVELDKFFSDLAWTVDYYTEQMNDKLN